MQESGLLLECKPRPIIFTDSAMLQPNRQLTYRPSTQIDNVTEDGSQSVVTMSIQNKKKKSAVRTGVIREHPERTGVVREPYEPASGSESENDRLLTLPSVSTLSNHKYSNCKRLTFLCSLTFFSALGGFLFGYDTGVVSGAMIKIRNDFKLTPVLEELVVSITIAGAAIAALIAGPVSDFCGRKFVLLLASLVFTLGSILMSSAPTPMVLLIGRFVVGVGVGLAAMAVPLYISESAPAAIRGKLVVVNISFVTGGQFIATLIDGAFSGLPLNVGWRVMLGLAGIPSIIMFIGLIFMPKSPRWLVFHGKTKQAHKNLISMRRPEEVETELQEIIADYQEHKARKLAWWQLMVKVFTTRSVMLALVVGCGLQMFQQFGGINTVMYYSASIIQMAGFSDRDSIWLATIPAFGNFFFTIVGLLLVDRIGRRKLLLGSMTGVVFTLALLGISFYAMDITSLTATPFKKSECNLYSCAACVGNSQCGFCVEHLNSSYINGTCSTANLSMQSRHYSHDERCLLYFEQNTAEFSNGSTDTHREWYYNSCPSNPLAPLTIIVLFLYLMFFAPGMGPLPWTINSEIYPTWARSTAIAIATTVNWLCNLIVSMTFLTLTDTIGQPSTFWLYSCLGVLGLIFMILLVPETKGRKLEDVEELFHRPWFMNWCTKRR